MSVVVIRSDLDLDENLKVQLTPAETSSRPQRQHPKPIYLEDYVVGNVSPIQLT